MWKGTLTTAPVSSVAGFPPPEAVSPLYPGICLCHNKFDKHGKFNVQRRPLIIQYLYLYILFKKQFLCHPVAQR